MMWQHLSHIADLVLRDPTRQGWADDATLVTTSRSPAASSSTEQYHIALQHAMPGGEHVDAHISFADGAATISDCGDSVNYQRYAAGGWDDALLPALRACAESYGFRLDNLSGEVFTTVPIHDLRGAVLRLCQVRSAAAVALPMVAVHLTREHASRGLIERLADTVEQALAVMGESDQLDEDDAATSDELVAQARRHVDPDGSRDAAREIGRMASILAPLRGDLEDMAFVMHEEATSGDGPAWDDLPAATRQHWIDAAHAALKAFTATRGGVSSG